MTEKSWPDIEEIFVVSFVDVNMFTLWWCIIVFEFYCIFVVLQTLVGMMMPVNSCCCVFNPWTTWHYRNTVIMLLLPAAAVPVSHLLRWQFWGFSHCWVDSGGLTWNLAHVPNFILIGPYLRVSGTKNTKSREICEHFAWYRWNLCHLCRFPICISL